MTKDLFPNATSAEAREKLTELTKNIFGEGKVTKENIGFIIRADMGMIFDEITISAAQTRPTNIKYATNNYHASVKLSMEGVATEMTKVLDSTPEEKLIDKYLELKAAVYNLIKIKYESTDRYLRSLLDNAANRDKCATTSGDD